MAATPLTNTGSAITFSAALGNVEDSTNHQRLVHYYANNVPAQTTTITASFNGSATYRGIKIKRITGSSGYDVAASSAHNIQFQSAPTTGTDAVSSGNTSTLSAQPALISGFSVATAAARTTAVGTGFSNDQSTAWQFGTGTNMTMVHTNDAVQAISRLVDGFTGSEQVMIRRQAAAALLAVVNQRLVMGVRGAQVLAVEVLVNTPAVSKLIREGTLEQLYGVMEAESQSGSLTLNHSLEALVRAERVSPREAERYVSMRESRPALPKARSK